MKLRFKWIMAIAISCWATASIAGTGTSSPFWINSDIALYASVPGASSVTVASAVQDRIATATAIAAAFRADSPATPNMAVGDTFKIRWADGSGETFLIEDVTSSTGAVPVTGTQFPAGSIPKGPNFNGNGCGSDCISTAPVGVPSQGPANNTTYTCITSYSSSNPIDLQTSCSWS